MCQFFKQHVFGGPIRKKQVFGGPIDNSRFLVGQLENSRFFLSQLGNHLICSTNKKTTDFLMGQLGNCMFCSTNKKTAGFRWANEKTAGFYEPIRIQQVDLSRVPVVHHLVPVADGCYKPNLQPCDNQRLIWIK